MTALNRTDEENQVVSVNSTRRLRGSGIAATLIAGLVASACQNTLPETQRLDSANSRKQIAMNQFVADEPKAIETIYVPRDRFKLRTEMAEVPAKIRATPVDVVFNSQGNLSDLVQVLSVSGIQIGYRWIVADEGSMVNRRLPFLRFKGTVGELLRALQSGLGVAATYENGVIFLTDRGRYSISLPQEQAIMTAMKTEIESLGATEVLASTTGGKIIYTAPPSLNEEVISPFLSKVSRNLAVINMQTAVVTIGLTDESRQGFDWSKLRLAIDSTNKTVNGTGTAETIGTNIGIVGSGVTLGSNVMGSIFGLKGVVTVAGAIDFLSTFGRTDVNQNVQMKSLSGAPMRLRSGEDVPYVKGVSASTASRVGSGNLDDGAVIPLSSTDTAIAETGLTIEMTPHFDGDSELVTVNVKVELKSITSYVELSAGNQIGSLTQPIIQEQELTDIVRLQAGRTVIVGGLQYDSVTTDGREPAFARRFKTQLGTRGVEGRKSALFIILRPTITKFEAEAK